VAVGAAMILATSGTIQIAAAIAHDLFHQLGPTGASALRFALGAVIIFVAVRPRLLGRGTGGRGWPSPPTASRLPR
jgi:threonine/homoserine efflux transporter RhtA